jgi:hypothetical protein
MLETDELEYTGPKSLTQFNVISKTFYSMDANSNVKVEIAFQRIFSYHLTNTFVPTTSLLIIAEITLYFDETQAELAVGLSLTIMLVMYTMYQSINESLTKTAYLKLIDYWLLFCLLVPFVIFIIEIYWILHKTEMTKKSKASWVEDKQKKTSRKLIQNAAPVLTFLFIVTYIAAAFIIYNGRF